MYIFFALNSYLLRVQLIMAVILKKIMYIKICKFFAVTLDFITLEF